MSRTGRDAAAQRGFTLIELVVVLAILALVTAMALPFLAGAGKKADARLATREIAAGLRLTRNLAMVRGRAEAFFIDTATGAFRAGSTATPQRLPGDVRLVLFTTAGEQRSASAGSIRFFADGSSTGGGIRLQAGNSRSEVLVDWLTGHLTIGDGADAATP
ncbi:MAG: GspH/FimT family pseudopilin [Stellaceae bacterium]